MKTARTLRRLPPETRKLARAINDLEKSLARVKRQIDTLASMERDNLAWLKRQESYRNRGEVDPLSLDPMERSILGKATENLF